MNKRLIDLYLEQTEEFVSVSFKPPLDNATTLLLSFAWQYGESNDAEKDVDRILLLEWATSALLSKDKRISFDEIFVKLSRNEHFQTWLQANNNNKRSIVLPSKSLIEEVSTLLFDYLERLVQGIKVDLKSRPWTRIKYVEKSESPPFATNPLTSPEYLELLQKSELWKNSNGEQLNKLFQESGLLYYISTKMDLADFEEAFKKDPQEAQKIAKEKTDIVISDTIREWNQQVKQATSNMTKKKRRMPEDEETEQQVSISKSTNRGPKRSRTISDEDAFPIFAVSSSQPGPISTFSSGSSSSEVVPASQLFVVSSSSAEKKKKKQKPMSSLEVNDPSLAATLVRGDDIMTEQTRSSEERTQQQLQPLSKIKQEQQEPMNVDYGKCMICQDATSVRRFCATCDPKFGFPFCLNCIGSLLEDQQTFLKTKKDPTKTISPEIIAFRKCAYCRPGEFADQLFHDYQFVGIPNATDSNIFGDREYDPKFQTSIFMFIEQLKNERNLLKFKVDSTSSDFSRYNLKTLPDSSQGHFQDLRVYFNGKNPTEIKVNDQSLTLRQLVERLLVDRKANEKWKSMFPGIKFKDVKTIRVEIWAVPYEFYEHADKVQTYGASSNMFYTWWFDWTMPSENGLETFTDQFQKFYDEPIYRLPKALRPVAALKGKENLLIINIAPLR